MTLMCSASPGWPVPTQAALSASNWTGLGLRLGNSLSFVVVRKQRATVYNHPMAMDRGIVEAQIGGLQPLHAHPQAARFVCLLDGLPGPAFTRLSYCFCGIIRTQYF